MINGFLVSKPAPEVIDLQEYAKSRKGSVPNSVPTSVSGINKLIEIHNFIRSNGRF